MNKLYVTEDWSFAPATLTLKYSASNTEEMIDPKTAMLLQFLIDNHKQVSSREEIYLKLYGIENARADGTITAYVSKLRKLLEAKTDSKGKYIRTIPKAGYQFIGQFQVTDIEPELKVESIKLQSMANSFQNTPNRESEEQGPKQLFSLQQIVVLGFFLALIMFYASIKFSSSHSNELNDEKSEWSIINQDISKTNTVALSSDGLNLAFVQGSENEYALVVKDTFSTNQRIVFRSKKAQIAAPAFSPSGTQIAFLQQNNNSCFIQTVNLASQGFEKPKFSTALNCGLWHSELKLGYLNERELVYIHRNSMTNQNVVFTFDLETLESTRISSPELQGIGDYSFAVNPNTQQIAILSGTDSTGENDESTSVYIYNTNESAASHVLTVKSKLLSLEWLTNEKLIALQGSDLEMIDIAHKDIRPTNLAKMKEELNHSL